MARAVPDPRRAAAAIAAVVLIAAAALTVSPGSSHAHEDAGGQQRLDDDVTIHGLVIRAPVGENSNDDDWFDGDSEYCVRVTYMHTGHDGASGESFDCADLDWDAIIPGSDPPTQWEDRDVGGGFAERSFVGTQGVGGGSWVGPLHTRECAPTEPWLVRVQLSESDSDGLGSILTKLGNAFDKAKLPAQLGARVAMVGPLATAAGAVLTAVFEGMTNLGRTDLKWDTDAGDPTDEETEGEVPPNQGFVALADRFRVTATKKIVRRVADPCPTPTPTGTPTDPTDPPTDPTDPPTDPTDPPTDPTDPPTDPTDPPTDPTSPPTDPTSPPTDPTSPPPSPTGSGSGSPSAVGVAATAVDEALVVPAAGPTRGLERHRARADGKLQRGDCGADGVHLFCPNWREARSSWRDLRGAAADVARVRTERGAPRQDQAATKQALLELTVLVGQQVVADELAEAEAVGGVPDRVLRRARTWVARGDRLTAHGVERIRPGLVRAGLNAYEHAYRQLARALHPTR